MPAGEPPKHAASSPQEGAIGDLPPRKPPRTRILLVEDIVANQVVAATLLRREGHHVEIATTGPAAIRAIQAEPFDLVFMDTFMPGMSGQETTKIIRALPEPARSTPIVALTANIGPEDEALFKAAGMDGILFKPVAPAELLTALDRYIWSAHQLASQVADALESRVHPETVRLGISHSEGPNPDLPHTVPILRPARIDELRTNLPPETFASLIEECLIDMDHRLPALRRALTADAPGAVTVHAHALVGIAAGYGMAAMEGRLRTIMAAARDGDLASLGPTIIIDLETDFEEAARSLREILGGEVV